MRIIHCNGTIEDKPCNETYAIIQRVISRERQSFFYPFDDAQWKITRNSPQTKCGKCGKPLKGQIPIEVFYE